MQLTEMVERALVRHGSRPADAKCQAATWLEGELRGHPSHGFQRLPTMLARIRNGQLNVNAQPAQEWITESVVAVDGDNGFGPVATFMAVELIVERAATTGLAMALIRRAGHLGMLAPYVEAIAARGSIGIALTTSEALVHPWGGASAMLGTNPIGIGVPAADGKPLVVDLSTSGVSAGKVLHHERLGIPLQPGWATDSAGLPTIDPSEARRGSLSPFGGPKGYALGLAFEVIVAGLTATAFGRDVTGTLDETAPSTKGDLLLCLDPGRLGHLDLGARAAAYLEEIRHSAPAAQSQSVLVPGDRSRESRQQVLSSGVDIDAGLWKLLQD
jgi:LDH2 family malate/lactate/ureidoglycolate dehydrogenase